MVFDMATTNSSGPTDQPSPTAAVDNLSAVSVLTGEPSGRAPEPQVGRPCCRHCNGEGLLAVEAGSHWDVRFEVCGYCDGTGVGTLPNHAHTPLASFVRNFFGVEAA